MNKQWQEHVYELVTTCIQEHNRNIYDASDIPEHFWQSNYCKHRDYDAYCNRALYHITLRYYYDTYLQSLQTLYLLELMEGQSKEEDNEEMVSVPENLKVGATDELQGGGDHQE